MQYASLLVGLLLTLPPCYQSEATKPTWMPEMVSMVQLIVTPERYEGKKVAVVGFLRLEFEGNALYLHQDDYDHRIYKNGLWLDVGRNPIDEIKQLNMQYVLVMGTFDIHTKGQMDAMAGSLTGVRMIAWPPSNGRAAQP